MRGGSRSRGGTHREIDGTAQRNSIRRGPNETAHPNRIGAYAPARTRTALSPSVFAAKTFAKEKSSRANVFTGFTIFSSRLAKLCADPLLAHLPTHFERSEAHMQTNSFAQSLAGATTVALATIMLAACGPGNSSPSQASAANAPARANPAAQAQDASAPLPQASTSAMESMANGIGTSAQSATNAANAADFASDAVASAQASLAADSQQVAPIMSYAPGDAPPASTGNDSSSTATTSQ